MSRASNVEVETKRFPVQLTVRHLTTNKHWNLT